MQPTAPVRMTTRKKVALWLLISPTGLFIATLVLFVLINFFTTLLTPMVPDTEQMTMPIGLVVSNVIFFVIGVVCLAAWLPGLIVGTVLLSTKNSVYAKN